MIGSRASYSSSLLLFLAVYPIVVVVGIIVLLSIMLQLPGLLQIYVLVTSVEQLRKKDVRLPGDFC